MTQEQALEPAAALAARTSSAFPNDSDAYREARTALLAQEIELRRQIERVAALRQPAAGGEIPKDYGFINEQGAPVRLSEMFGDSDTLITYFWMFGPERKRPCPFCTLQLAAIEGNARDIAQCAPLAIIGRSPIRRQIDFKHERGWRHLKFFEAVGDDFPRDYHGLDADGDEMGAFTVFVRRGGTIRLFCGDQMGIDTCDPGQGPRGAPELSTLWNVLDLTPEGRRPDWNPKLEY